MNQPNPRPTPDQVRARMQSVAFIDEQLEIGLALMRGMGHSRAAIAEAVLNLAIAYTATTLLSDANVPLWAYELQGPEIGNTIKVRWVELMREALAARFPSYTFRPIEPVEPKHLT